MATKLRLIFNASNGTTTTHNYNYANSDATTQAISTLASTIISNGDIFANVPISLKSATIITTTEQDVTPSPNP